MVQMNVTFDEKSYRAIMSGKPKWMKKSEWVRNLAMERLETLKKDDIMYCPKCSSTNLTQNEALGNKYECNDCEHVFLYVSLDIGDL